MPEHIWCCIVTLQYGLCNVTYMLFLYFILIFYTVAFLGARVRMCV